MIQRYTLKEMGNIWSVENKFQKWLEVEISVCKAWSKIGEIPRQALSKIIKKAKFDIKRINEIEEIVKHDVIAFLTSVAEQVGDVSRFIHKGLTSSDIIDTALSILMKEASDIIIKDIKTFKGILKKQSLKHKHTICIGRSHGVHAEPMTFGLKFALWYKEMDRCLERIEKARKIISIGKISGAVGTFSSIPPIIEKTVCKELGLTPEPVATQVIQRDRHAEYLTTLALIAGSIEKISIEIRHLQRTEVLEVEEPFRQGQKGSSAMPHKRNPVGCENLSGLARIVRSNAIAAMENIPLWHERDISHSSVERVIIPDSTILIDYMLNRLSEIIKDLQIYPEKMKENLCKSYGLYNSQKVMLALVRNGLSREDSYSIVQRNAMKSWREKTDFKELLLEDTEVTKYLSKKDIEDIFNIKHYLKNIDYIYKQTFKD